MKKTTFIASALVCALLFAASTASAGIFGPRAQATSASAQTTWTQQSPTPPNPMVQTPVAGYSPNFAAPQPATMELLDRRANRLIRWQGWLDVDAFSVSVLNQMQNQLGSSIAVGSFSLEDEPALAEAVLRASRACPTFVMCPILEAGGSIQFEGTPKLFVWTYRHNFADRGLYQLYISAKGKMFIGTKIWEGEEPITVYHKDIQSLYYEFGSLRQGSRPVVRKKDVYVDVEVWRGAVVNVDHTGALTVAGTQRILDLPVDEVPGGLVPLERHSPVAVAPLSDWERAPSLICNPNYNPLLATGAAFVGPLERALSISGNAVQSTAGSTGGRVGINQNGNNIPRLRVITPFRFR